MSVEPYTPETALEEGWNLLHQVSDALLPNYASLLRDALMDAQRRGMNHRITTVRCDACNGTLVFKRVGEDDIRIIHSCADAQRRGMIAAYEDIQAMIERGLEPDDYLDRRLYCLRHPSGLTWGT